MISRIKHLLPRLGRQEKGGVAVEFAVIGPILVLLIAGILDFGHAWFMKQIVTNASREGARYGVTYRANATNTRVAPNAYNPTIQNYIIQNYLTNSGLPSDAHPAVTLAGTGLATGASGAPLEVTVTATKTWWILSSLLPGLGSSQTLSATTVMLCE
jgi:Flp pilus assembly protein TadG